MTIMFQIKSRRDKKKGHLKQQRKYKENKNRSNSKLLDKKMERN